MILNANFLAAGQSGVNGNSKYTFLTNESSIYSGMCVYTLNLGMQLEINRNLREITRKGITEITFFFKQQLDRDYYCTIFLSYAGEHIVSFCNFLSTQNILTLNMRKHAGMLPYRSFFPRAFLTQAPFNTFFPELDFSTINPRTFEGNKGLL